MKKIMGHLTGKLSLSILTVIVLLVGVLAGQSGITSKASGPSATASAPTATQSPAVSKASAQAVSHAAAKPAASKPAASETAAVAAALKDPKMDKEAAAKAYSRSPVAFEPNQGQTDSRVQYMAKSLGYQVFVTGPASAEMQFVYGKTPGSPDMLAVNFAGANAPSKGQLLEPTGGVSNYYVGPDSSKWVEGVPNYSKLLYSNIYPGIDVIYQGDHTSLRYDFVVHPGADPKAIRIAYQGDHGLSIDKDGNAIVDLSHGHLVASKPVVYQEYAGQKHTVSGSYVLTADKQFAFEIGPYDKTQSLTIDPSNTYASYVGPDATKTGVALATLSTQLNGIALDNIGDIFMTGTTLSPAYGATIGQCAFVIKASLNLVTVPVKPTATDTFCGLTASNNAVGNGIAWSAAGGGTVAVVGVTNAGTNWPVSHPLAAEPAANENYHAFVIDMTTGLGVTWNTLLVGAGAELATGVAVETAPHAGRIHVVGGTSSDVGTGGSSFLNNTGFKGQPFQATQASSVANTGGFGSTNAFYVAIDQIVAPATVPTAAFATYFGGYNTDIANAVAVDSLGNAYVAGTADSFGAGTVVGVTGFPAGGGGCPVNPVVTFPMPNPTSDFLWTPIRAQGTAIVNGGVVTGITITNPGAGYAPSQNGAFVVVEGCFGTAIHMVVQEPTTTGLPGGPALGGQSGNNLPIPTTTLTLTNPGTGYFAGPPNVTFAGGGCTVEPTAVASVDSFAPAGGLDTLVLTSFGEGCTSPPVVTIDPPPTVGGVQGVQATATYTWGTNPVAIDPNGAHQPSDHGFVAKFNPNAPAATGSPTPVTNPATLSYAVVIGGAGPVGISTAPFFSYTAEHDYASAIAVDNFGNAYVAGATVNPAALGPALPIPAAIGTFPLLPNPGFTPITGPNTTVYGTANRIVFQSPGTSAGVVTSITLTSAGLGYPASTTIPVTFFFPTDTTGVNPRGSCSVLPTAHAITDTDGSIDINGLVLDSAGVGCTTAPNIAFLSPHTIPATAYATLGTALVGNCRAGAAQGFSVCSYVLEMVSNQIINNGPVTTSTQDGLLLGLPLTSTAATPPTFVAGFPALVYASIIAGDEACTNCGPTSTNPPTVATAFGNGLGAVPANSQTVIGGVFCADISGVPIFLSPCSDPFNAGPPNGVPMVNGEMIGNAIAVDALGNAYVSGESSPSNFVLAEVIGNETVMMRRRVNARGYPTNPTTETGGAASPAAANTLFLADFPAQLDALSNATVTPFGSIPIGPNGLANVGALSAAAFDTATNSACFDGWTSVPLPSEGHATAISIFPSGAGTEPATAFEFFGLAAGPSTGFAACTQFLQDIVIGPQNLPSQSGVLFTIPAGTTAKFPNGATNTTFTSQTANIVATIPPGIPPSATISFGVVGKVYFEGTHIGTPISSATAVPIDWLTVSAIAGTTITLSLNPALFPQAGAPGASYLDPGTYYCYLTLTPTVTGATADNAGIPQTIIVTLNVTGSLDVNTAAGGGQPATGTNLGANGNNSNIVIALSQGTAGTAHWVAPTGGTAPVLDTVGNLVLNIPVISEEPLNPPSNGAFVFLVDQSVCPQGVSAGSNPATSCMQPFNPPGTTPGSVPFSILHSGAASGAPVLIGSTAGSIFLNPLAGLVEQAPGIFVNDALYLPNGGVPCGAPGSFLPFGTFDFTSKAEAFDTVCYIQVVIPPTILQGAPTGQGFTATFQLQGAANLSNPVTPLVNNPSLAFVTGAPAPNSLGTPAIVNEFFSTAAPNGCQFGNPPTGLTGATGVCTPVTATATINITINPQAGPLIINSPWISNTNLPGGCLSGGIGFTTPVCNTNGPVIPIAPFTVPGQVRSDPGVPALCVTQTCYSGTVTSAITGVQGGNNVLNNPFNDVVLDSRNLGTTAPTTFSATVVPGINSQAVWLAGPSVSVSPLQVQNDLNVFSNITDRLDDRDIQTCTVASPPIPAGVLAINGSTTFPVTGVLPASTANVTTTAFTIGIVNPAGAAMADGFYASTINVVPSGDNGNQGASIPVCLEVGNNIVVSFATIPPPLVVPPPFSGAFGFLGSNIIAGQNCYPWAGPLPPDAINSAICTVSPGLFIEAGNVQDVQVIATGLGPNQFAPLSGGPSFGTPGYLNVPVDIVAAPTCATAGGGQTSCNQAWATPFVAPANIGNEFSASAVGAITLGTFTAANCSAGPSGIGSPTGPCLTTAYRDEVLAPPSGLPGTVTPPGGIPAQPYFLNFVITATGDGLLAATGPVDAPMNVFTASLNVNISSGPGLLYSWATATNPVPSSQVAPGIVSFFTIVIPGTGYLNAPTVTLTGGGCAVEPTASANITNPGPLGFVSLVYFNTLGQGCTSPPLVTISNPETPGGIVAQALAVVSNGVIPFTFTQQVASPPATSVPLFTEVTVLASAPGVSVNAVGPFYNPPVPFAHWLNVVPINCNPITFDPDPAHVCQFTFSTNGAVSTLPQGTFQAWVNLISNPFAVQPAVETVLVTLNVTNGVTVLSTVNTTAGAHFDAVAGSGVTSPSKVVTQLSLNAAPASGGATCATNPAGPNCVVPFTASVSQINGPPSWLFINGGTASVSGNLQGPGGTPVSLTITINPTTLTALATATNLPLTWNGTVQVTTPSSMTSNPILSIPVSVTITAAQSIQFVPPGPFTTAFTIGQAAPATSVFTTQLQQFGTSGTVNFTSSCGSPAVTPCPWITLSPTSTTLGLQTLTITIVPANLPTTPGPASATITANGVSSLTTTSATVTVTIAAPPVINLPALTCTPASPVTAGTASVTCTTTAALSVSPANPTTLPATVTASVSSSPAGICTIAPASSTITLSNTAQTLTFTVTPTSGTGLPNGTCTPSVSVTTTGGITPAITASTSATVITVQTGVLNVTPASQVINLPTLAAPATFTETVRAQSNGANDVAVPFNCTPSVALPIGGNWLACTNGTTTTAPPFATSTGTVTSSGLAQGQYGGALAFSSPQLGVINNPPNVPVTLNIGQLAVSGGPINFQHQFNVTTPATATLQVSAGPAAINWVASAPVPSAGTTNCNWLIPGAASGTTPNNGSNTVSVSYNPALLPNQNTATYQCTINYSAAASYGSTAPAIPVVVTLFATSEPVLIVTPPNAQIISALLGSTTPVSATFNVSAITTFSTPPNTVSISVAPAAAGNGFIGNPPGVFTATLSSTTTPATLTITATASPAGGALAQGTYTGLFIISSPSTAPVQVTVQFVVVPSCEFTVAPPAVNLTNAVPSSGTPVTATGTFTVTPGVTCGTGNTWTATSNVPWLIITGGGTGNGSAAVVGTFNALSNPKSNQRTATITITPSAGNPAVVQFTQTGSTAATNLRQVTALYQSILGRDPDPAGYAFWTGAGAAGLGQMADSFFTSPEAFNSDWVVMAAWQAATGAPPTFAEYTNSVGNLRNGSQSVTSLFTTLSNNANPSYSAANLYQNLLGRAPGSGDSACIASGLANCFATIIGSPATNNPVQATNNEFQSTGTFQNLHAGAAGDHSNNLYINLLYVAILGRTADPGGLQYWLGIANGGGAGLDFQGATGYPTRIQILGPGTAGQGFIGSPEFQSLFQ